MNRIFALVVCLGVMLLSAGQVMAQRGDHKGESEPEVWKHMNVPPAPVLTPQQGLASLKVAPGFHVELVASEPLVEDPIAMTWDAAGRLWVVEMRGFMPNVDGKGEDQPIGRIVVLEDTNHDGKMDKATTYLDHLVMPRAIALVPGGVLVAEPPKLWYCQDDNGDLKCDKKTEVFDHFGSQGPVEHTANGLLWGLDNILHNANLGTDFRFDKGKLIPLDTIGRGQWGIAQDDYGNLFINNNSNYLQADLVPALLLQRNPDYPAKSGISQGIADTQAVYSIRVNPGINRGYQKSMLWPDGRLKRTTAACGPTIYRGDQFPAKFEGNAFVPEPSGNVVAQFNITGNGESLRAHHVTYPDAKWGKREFLASTDERFRPVHTYTGPDGCLYVVDMYRGILQHKIYVTTFLRKQILERGLDKPVGLGRIYRIVSNAKPVDHHAPQLASATGPQLIGYLSADNGWTRDTAQHELIWRHDPADVDALRSAASHGDKPLGRIHALWALAGLDALDAPTAVAAMSDADAHVRAQSVRAADALIAAGDKTVVARLTDMASDKDPMVRRAVAFALGDAPRGAGPDAAMAKILTQDAASPLVREAVISGLHNHELIFAQTLLGDRAWTTHRKGYDNTLHDLAMAIMHSREPNSVGGLLAMISAEPAGSNWRAVAMLDGMVAATRHLHPVNFKNKPAAIDLIEKSNDKQIRSLMGKLDKYITWSGDTRKIAQAPNAKPLTPAEQKRFDQGKVLYTAICMACHQPNGQGMIGLAPPLADSPIAQGNPQRVLRIVLNGLQGPVTIDDQTWNLVMPPHRDNPLLNDEKLAAILTFVRRNWGDTASPITPDQVAAIRKATEGRTDLWTLKELEKYK